MTGKAGLASDIQHQLQLSPKIDESLYSRQLYVMGHEAQYKMSNASIALFGCSGLAIEIAKNIILAGVQSVTIFDDVMTTYADLNANFYLSEKDLGVSRSAACLAKLCELNPYVKVSIASLQNVQDVQDFTVVIVTEMTESKKVEMNAFCHKHDIAYIDSQVCGVFGTIFCDFGDKFQVLDTNGEAPSSCMLAGVAGNTVTVMEDKRHQLETGDVVTFREVQGALADKKWTITVTGPYTFTIDGYAVPEEEVVKGGYVDQVKQPKSMTFLKYQQAVTTPGEFLISDFAKIGRSEVLHQGFRALGEYHEKHGHFPQPGHTDQVEECMTMCLSLNELAKQNEEFFVDAIKDNAKILSQLFDGSSSIISPMCAFFGGMVGQEALKACSGKFTPISQFFYFDAVECLPDDPLPLTESSPMECRYDAQIALFGKTFLETMRNQTLFLVGAGAIGCEMLKNWAMMGIATGKEGAIHITDMDIIEKSNLNRQFLFRQRDVQKAKSTTAALAVQVMNPEITVHAQVVRVGSETESVFNDTFYESLDGVCTALDNVDARLYMDHRCLFYGLPMFESGTLGTKGNTQIVVPHLTEHYGASRDPPEKSIPICTLKNFPNAIEHTLQWARDYFEGIFFQIPTDVNKYLGTTDFLSTVSEQPNTRLDTLARLKDSLVANRPYSFEECTEWARLQFEDLFSNQVKQLLFNFPVDQLTTSGAPFWSGPKRPPTPLEFDMHDATHLSFIIAGANMRAENYGLVGRSDKDYFMTYLPTLVIAAFVPKNGIKIATTESERKKQVESQSMDVSTSDQCETLLSALPSPSSMAGYRMAPVEFEKDDDAHMEVIVATSNLRARNYKIPEADMHQSRFIAGKIIPAIATTTALVTGLVCIEMIKVFQKRPLESYKNGFVNLALPLVTFSEPLPPPCTKSMLNGKEYKYTPWDRIELQEKNLTLKTLLEYFTKEYNVEVSMLSYGVTILYAMFSKKAAIAERMPLTLPQLVEKITKKPISEEQKYLTFEVCANDMDGEDVEFPSILYRL